MMEKVIQLIDSVMIYSFSVFIRCFGFAPPLPGYEGNFFVVL